MGAVVFDLHRLGWSAFQDLCQVIMREVLGQTFQVFSNGHDGGRDGYFQGAASPVTLTGLDGLVGQVVAQVKHTSVQNKHLVLSDLSPELSKVKDLVFDGLCDSYIVMTNAGLEGSAEAVIRKSFEEQGVSKVFVLGSEWINQTIRDSPRLRALVPRVYGLGDLSSILDARVLEQTRTILEGMREDLAVFVPTSAYRKAERALHEHGFVLILGEAGAGKSVIASTLAAGATDKWSINAVICDSPKDFLENWNPNEPTLYWIDDAFGVMQYNKSTADDWNRAFQRIPTIRKGGSRIVLTSRDYIWNAARSNIKAASFNFLQEDQVVIDIQALTRGEKESIVYAHLKNGSQPEGFLSTIKTHLREIVRDAPLLPEAARRLAHPTFTAGIDPANPSQVAHFLHHPEQYLKDLLGQLEANQEAAIALIFAHGQKLEGPLSLTELDFRILSMLGASESGVRKALSDLEGSLVRYQATECSWTFRHPSVGDGYTALLSDNPDKTEVYLRGAAFDRLLAEIDYDREELEPRLVRIPSSLEPLLVQRLGEARTINEQHRVLEFLANRCRPDWARAYLETNPSLLRRLVRPGAYIYAYNSEMQLLADLTNAGALPEQARETFVASIADLAVEIPDAAWISNTNVRRALGSEGVEVVRNSVREALLDDPEHMAAGFETYNYDSQSAGTPEDYVSELIAAGRLYVEEFADEEAVRAAAERLESFAGRVVERLYEDGAWEDSPDQSFAPPQTSAPAYPEEDNQRQVARDPFDDLDE